MERAKLRSAKSAEPPVTPGSLQDRALRLLSKLPNGIFPDSFAHYATNLYLRYTYVPAAGALEKLARYVLWMQPNHVTYASLACFVPVVALLLHGSGAALLGAALLVVVHDFLDRFDGAVARALQQADSKRAAKHDGRFGAFLDAQCDKVFHVGFLGLMVWVGWLSERGAQSPFNGLYVLLGCTMIVTQVALFYVRCMDYWFAACMAAIKSRGEGKFATTACNAAAMTACLALRSEAGAAGVHSNGWAVLTVVLLLIGVDMALRSLKTKLRVRFGNAARATFFRAYYRDMLRMLAVSWPMWDKVWEPMERALGATLRLGQLEVVTVNVLFVAQLLGVVPFAVFFRQGRLWLSGAVVVGAQGLLVAGQHVLRKQLEGKKVQHLAANRSEFFAAITARLFYAVCLWSVVVLGVPVEWAWWEKGIVYSLLLMSTLYELALIGIRIDDAYPAHPASVAAWARIGGFGVAFGVGVRGKIREKLQPLTLLLLSVALLTGRQGLFVWWVGYAAIGTLFTVLCLNHSNLLHKLRVRQKTMEGTIESTRNCIVEQDIDAVRPAADHEHPYDVVFSVGCFDMFHAGHLALVKRMRTFGKRLVIGIHDDESIYLLKGRFPVENVVKRMRSLKKYVDQVFVIPSVDPSPYLDAIVDREAAPKERMVFVRGADMPKFPGREVAEQLMDIKLTPYTHGVSSTLLRKKLIERSPSDDEDSGDEDEEEEEEAVAVSPKTAALMEKEKQRRLRDGVVDPDEEVKPKKQQTWILFHNQWVASDQEPPGISWLRYGDDFFRYQTGLFSPTIQ